MVMGSENLKYSTPEAQGISSADILKFLEAVREKDGNGAVDLHSFQIIRNDFIIAEGAGKPFAKDRYHRIYSAAKGIVAVGVLLALQDGILRLDEKLVDIFPDKLPENLSPRMEKVTVFHLLTMNTGQAEDTCADLFASDDWVKTFLSLAPAYEPGTWFCYNNGIPHILAAIVERKSGMNIFQYMKPRVLDPLGMDVLCRVNKQGEQEPSTVCVTQEGLTKIGYLFLKKGRWNGRQLIQEKWCELFGKFHVPTVTHHNAFRRYGYGFQVWKMPCEGFVFHGGNDNLSCVYTEANMVFSCMACNKTNHGVDLQQMFHEMVYEHARSYPLEENPEAYWKLTEALEQWNLAPMGSDRSGLSEEISGEVYQLEANPLGCRTIRFDFQNHGETLEIVTAQADGEHRMACGFGGQWPESTDYVIIPVNLSHGNFIDGEDPTRNMASGAWRDRNTLRVYGRSFGRIESDKLTFCFEGDQLTIRILTPALALPGVVTDRSKGEFVLHAHRLAGGEEAME